MPSKGVQAYSYITVPGITIEFSVPGQSIKHSSLRQWTTEDLEVDASKIHSLFDKTGKFSFRVTRSDGSEVTMQYNEINSLTGNLDGGSMSSIRNTRSVITADGIVVAYGFYDAGRGEHGLPSRDQCYVTVTARADEWMAAAAPRGSSAASLPFSWFVVPTPHDVGMNSMQSADLVLQSGALEWISERLLDIPVLHGLNVVDAGSDYVSKVIYSLAITQKDRVADMLTLGARYFEFRPGKLPDDIRRLTRLEDKPYFIHTVIPGLAYDEFLDSVLEFLQQHTLEIVVVSLRSDGILAQCPKPSAAEKQQILDTALQRHPGVAAGSQDDMTRLTVDELRNQKKRLIMLDGANQYSSYNETAYNTLNGDSIVKAFEGMNVGAQAGHPLTLLQCQATATLNKDVVAYSVLDSNASTSCMMATKAICDSKTLPWLRDHALQKFPAGGLMVIMNDFFDGATADVAIELSKQRFAKAH